MLPATDGHTAQVVCERIVAARPDLPVVLLTAHADLNTAVAALRARDAAAAVEAMRLHLARVSGHLLATDSAAGDTWR